MAAAAPEKLAFEMFTSVVSTAFWSELARRKLEIMKLSDAPVPVLGSWAAASRAGVSPVVNLTAQSFQAEYAENPRHFVARGHLLNANTIEAFRALDTRAIMRRAAAAVAGAVADGSALRDPSLLNQFVLTSFSDLKKFVFTSLFGAPALSATGATPVLTAASSLATSRYTIEQLTALAASFDQFRSPQQFVCAIDPVRESAVPLADAASCVVDGHLNIIMADPSSSAHPGWPLRNVLFLLSAALHVRSASVVLLREQSGTDVTTSRWLSIGLSPIDIAAVVADLQPAAPGPAGDPLPSLVSVSGLERNNDNKVVPRSVNLASLMDPAHLAESSVALNLKLMRWRLAPSLDLDAIAAKKALIIGAGTLGCNIARVCLGWGIKDIALVDSGRVSYSNPVRQSLFCFADCLDGGKFKAEAAAAALAQIFPGVRATAHVFEIPMPGHPVPPSADAKTRESVRALMRLIAEADVVFLGTDSRESRWLPTLLASSGNKLLINAALGFDTYLVLRHGGAPSTSTHSSSQAASSLLQPTRLGCYFCNDVVAPADSLTDRTLDQQCTVTRPAVSMMAAALAVELFVSVTQHPAGILTPAPPVPRSDGAADHEADQSGAECCLGTIPHQMRGFLGNFQTLSLVGHAYDRCTACSARVVAEYETRGVDMIMDAVNSVGGKFLQDLSGLSMLREEAAAASLTWADDDDEAFEM